LPSCFSSDGYELEAEPVVDHCEAAGGERETLLVDAGDMLAGSGLGVGFGEASCQGIDIPIAQRGHQVAGEDDALSLAPREPFLDQMICTSLKCPPNLEYRKLCLNLYHSFRKDFQNSKIVQ
jgi:hypothetical protein